MRRRFAGIGGVAALRLLIVAGLCVTLAAAAGSGRAGTAALLAASSGSVDSASSSVSATSIGAGYIHICALTGTAVKCWGSNRRNQLGDHTVKYSTTPVDVSGLTGDVTAIAMGSRHSCALTTAGGLKCWGYNRYGQLGDGTTVNRTMPVDVSGLSSGVTAIAASFHTCALTSAGGVKCWGDNSRGQLGDGTTVNRSHAGRRLRPEQRRNRDRCWRQPHLRCYEFGRRQVLGRELIRPARRRNEGGPSIPVDVSGLSGGATALAAGGFHSCALTLAGGVKCWGANASGQLGDGTTRVRSRPVDVSGLGAHVIAIAAGLRHSCALASAGGVKCWGLNLHGQLGDGTFFDRFRPVGVFGLSRGLTALAVGSFYGCARTRAGGVKCWGNNIYGQLGDGTEDNHRRPVSVVGFGPAQATLAIVSRSVQITPARVAAIRVRCGKAARCRGALTLSAAVRRRLVGSPRSRVRATVGARRFSISHGRGATVNVKLTDHGFRLLVRMMRLPTRVWITYAQADGTTTATTGSITLIAPKVNR